MLWFKGDLRYFTETCTNKTLKNEEFEVEEK